MAASPVLIRVAAGRPSQRKSVTVHVHSVLITRWSQHLSFQVPDATAQQEIHTVHTQLQGVREDNGWAEGEQENPR